MFAAYRLQLGPGGDTEPLLTSPTTSLSHVTQPRQMDEDATRPPGPAPPHHRPAPSPRTTTRH